MWLDGKARYEIVKRSIYDEIVKIRGVGASGWTENLRGGTRRTVERVPSRAFPRAFFRLGADAEHFQPSRVLLSGVADQVRAFYFAFRRITFGKID
jgi:hypothetical protein